jgi:hypothetical protein
VYTAVDHMEKGIPVSWSSCQVAMHCTIIRFSLCALLGCMQEMLFC